MNEYLTGHEIERWWPEKEEEILGNHSLLEHGRRFVTQPGLGINFLVTGRSRSGKTRTINLIARSKLCEQRTRSLAPCGQCPTCKLTADDRYEYAGVLRSSTCRDLNFFWVHCNAVSRERLQETAHNAAQLGRSIIFLDEVVYLFVKDIAQTILTEIDEADQVMWIASSASYKRVGSKFGRSVKAALMDYVENRYSEKLDTELALEDETTEWTRKRCETWKIDYDHLPTLHYLVQRARCVPGHILHVLAKAADRDPRLITHEMVQKHNFKAG
jgi:DNA polymerase III delta prime subunit